MAKRIVIEDEIFEMFPNFYRGLVFVKDMENPLSCDPIKELLGKTLSARAIPSSLEDPRIQAWSDVHRAFGSNPKKYPPSILSLVKRIVKKPNLPFINTAVALFNYISLKYMLPCGGDDVATIKGNLVLGVAKGSETFVALGSDKVERPVPGEIIYYDDASGNVMCRRWNWRNGEITKITEASKSVVINVDCIPPVTAETGDKARDEMAQLLADHCKARTQTGALRATCREIALEI